MQFTVPQFIERKAKIVGPLTFHQFIFIGAAAGICAALYFVVPLGTFIVAAAFVMSVAASLAFVKIGGNSLPIVVKNLFIFSFNPKVYLWKKKIQTPHLVKKIREIETEKKDEEEKKSPLKISEHSRLKDLATRLETKNK